MLEKNDFGFIVKGCFVVQSPVVHNCCYPFNFFLKTGYVFSVVLEKNSAVVSEGLTFDSVGV